MSRQTDILGREGEQIAARHLEARGARVLGRNVRTGAGEIDLVVEHDGDLVGVEVKTRREGQPALPEEAVNPARLARLSRALGMFAEQHGYQEHGWRLDVVAIEIGPSGAVLRCEHIRDAYQ